MTLATADIRIRPIKFLSIGLTHGIFFEPSGFAAQSMRGMMDSVWQVIAAATAGMTP
jgi:hypothetical protein